jgi:hypothetical protein
MYKINYTELGKEENIITTVCTSFVRITPGQISKVFVHH